MGPAKNNLIFVFGGLLFAAALFAFFTLNKQYDGVNSLATISAPVANPAGPPRSDPEPQVTPTPVATPNAAQPAATTTPFESTVASPTKKVRDRNTLPTQPSAQSSEDFCHATSAQAVYAELAEILGEGTLEQRMFFVRIPGETAGSIFVLAQKLSGNHKISIVLSRRNDVRSPDFDGAEIGQDIKFRDYNDMQREFVAGTPVDALKNYQPFLTQEWKTYGANNIVVFVNGVAETLRLSAVLLDTHPSWATITCSGSTQCACRR